MREYNDEMRKLDMERDSIIAKFAPERENMINGLIDKIVSIGNDMHTRACTGQCTGTFAYVEDSMKSAFIGIKDLTERERLAIVASIYYAAGVDSGHNYGKKGVSKKELLEIQERMIGINELKDIAKGKQ